MHWRRSCCSPTPSNATSRSGRSSRRDGVLLKAVDALVQSSYGGLFFPINDAILDKGIDTEETGGRHRHRLCAHRGPPAVGGPAAKRLLLSPDGLQVAQALAANRASPSTTTRCCCAMVPTTTVAAWRSLRMNGERGQALVQKDTMQGMDMATSTSSTGCSTTTAIRW
jgi:hypothetical protein